MSISHRAAVRTNILIKNMKGWKLVILIVRGSVKQKFHGCTPKTLNIQTR